MDDEMKSKPLFGMRPSKDVGAVGAEEPIVTEEIVCAEHRLGTFGDLSVELREIFETKKKTGLRTPEYAESSCFLVVDDSEELQLANYVEDLDLLISALKRIRKSWKERIALRENASKL
jgi:hypothetical protein